MLSLLLGVSVGANVLLVLLYKNRCEKAKQEKIGLNDDIAEVKRCYNKTVDRVRELEKTCFEKDKTMIDIETSFRAKESAYVERNIGLVSENLALTEQVKSKNNTINDLSKLYEENVKLRKELNEVNGKVGRQSSSMKAMYKENKALLDNEKLFKPKLRELEDVKTLLKYKEAKLKEVEEIKNDALDTLKGILNMNRTDRRLFAKEGIVPVELIKLKEDIE